MLGGLYRYLGEADPRHFQPMNANFGLLDPIEAPKHKGGTAGRREAKKQALAERAQRDFAAWLQEHGLALGTVAHSQ
jgi:methylenetetrahydrofolate--tRNA-(uracil-5-)-methyltransferase